MPVTVGCSLLTDRLNAALAARADLQADTGSINDAEQPLTLARHLTPILEGALRAAGTAEARAELLHRILSVREDLLPGIPTDRMILT
jgi:hypothetical protein